MASPAPSAWDLGSGVAERTRKALLVGGSFDGQVVDVPDLPELFRLDTAEGYEEYVWSNAKPIEHPERPDQDHAILQPPPFRAIAAPHG